MITAPSKMLGWKRFQIGDLVVFLLGGLLLYGLISTAQRWQSVYQPNVIIDLSLRHLPLYSGYSLYRALIAYVLSFLFTVVFGYAAAKNRTAEKIIMPLLDIGQSIPVLGYLPGLVLGLVALFPKTNFGLELSCIIMVFTGQVWNMTFSFISSLKSVPTQLYEMADNVGLGKIQKLFRIEFPCAATGLAWNSLMSMAGGWFFLTVCESFTLGEKNFRLPGLGSYMALAIDQGDTRAMVAGVAAMTFLIVLMDFVIWRPIIAWTARFTLSEQHDTQTEIPFMTLLLKGSPIFQAFVDFLGRNLKRLDIRPSRSGPSEYSLEGYVAKKPTGTRRRLLTLKKSFDAPKFSQGILMGIMAGVGFFVCGKVYHLVELVRWTEWRDILIATSYTAMRVIFALLISSLWSIPAGIWIGSSPRLTRFFQPLIQLAASFPAPMLYPLALGVFIKLGIGLGISSSLLMLLGVQWYVLFNVLAGSISISQDLRESFTLFGMSKKSTWKKLYLPSVFPALVTGWVTAAGGAWNASIVSEFIQYKGQTLKTIGLGAKISEAGSSGNFHLLAACLIVMVITVVSINRLVWRKVYEVAETRFRFER